MPKKVAIDALALGDPPQGIGAYSLNLVKALAESPGDMEYVVFLPEKSLHYFKDIERSRFTLVSCRFPNSRGSRIAYQHFILPGRVRESGATLLHSVGNLLPLRYRGPSVLTVHDIDFAVHPDCSPWARRILFGTMTPSSLKKASVIVTDSAYSAETILRHYPGVPPEKIRTVPLGAPDINLPDEEEKKAVLRRHGLEGIYFLSVGTLEKRKNILLIIQSFEKYRESTSNLARLVLVGQPGHGFGDIRRSIARSPWRSDIIVTGYVPSGDLPGLYAGACALLLLSEAEGFGLPALEAMACGCPVIAARAGALPETCGGAAAYVSAGNMAEAAMAMIDLAAGTDRRAAFIRKGYQNLPRFSWPEHAGNIREIYRELAQSLAHSTGP